MLQKTCGIVLNTTKYSETSLIVKLYTRELGLQSCIINGVRNKRSKNKANLFQPLTLVDAVIMMNERSGLQRITEIALHQQYSHLPFDIIKSSIALFINEILVKSLKEAQGDPDIFDFIRSSLLFLDLSIENPANLHLSFMARLSRFLGFYPQGNYSSDTPVFDLQEGKFVGTFPQHAHFLSSNVSQLFSALLLLSYEDSHILKLHKTERKQLLTALILYFQLHLNGFGLVKSMEVLEEVIS